MKTLPFGTRTFIMGIINATPDSFSGDGLLCQADWIDAALEQARRFVHSGADVLDIGAESTRPGAQPVGQEEELDRLLPLLESLRKENLDVIISVDTSKAAVAKAALETGAHWINDVWALRGDPAMPKLAAQSGAPVVLMHNRSQPAAAEIDQQLGGRYVGLDYQNLVPDVCRELLEYVNLARAAGVHDEQIILDPGIGFGKTVEQNLELINHLDEIHALGFPVMLGPSRKGFIGYTLNLPTDQRLEGTLAACVVGILRGADILRVHDVKAAVRAARMTDAILGRKK